MKQKGGAAYKEMLGRMAFAFCTYAMDLSIPGWIQIFLSSNSEICYKNSKMWLIYFSFLFTDLDAGFLPWRFAFSGISQGQNPEPLCAF